MNLWKSFFIFYINMRHEKRSILEVNISLKCKLPEAVARRCSVKKVFLKISQISQENTYFRVSFLIKPQVCNFIKKEALTRVFFCEFCEISKNTFFIEHLWWLLLLFLKELWKTIMNRTSPYIRFLQNTFEENRMEYLKQRNYCFTAFHNISGTHH